jgi:arylsulfatase A-like enzyme
LAAGRVLEPARDGRGELAQGFSFSWPATVARAAALCVLVALGAGCAPSPPRPSIVVVTIDTLRADHLGSYGYFRDTSPGLDRFAHEALVFENAYSTAAVTLPAHVALWTSRYPNDTGVFRNKHSFSPRQAAAPRLFAQWLRDAGWRTGAFVSATPVAADTGLPNGFEVYEGPSYSMRPAAETTELALRWLETLDESYFLWVHYFEPHGPYEPPEAFRRFEADADLGAFLAARDFADPADAGVLERHDLYDGEIAATDAALSRLLGVLRGRDEWSELSVVILADHGEGLMEHGIAGHAHLGREQLHVPLLIKLPASLGVASGRRSELASTVDVVPTLAANLGLPVPPEVAADFEGFDLLRQARTEAFSQAGQGRHSLVTSAWRFVEYPTGPQLFDRRADPNELEDLANAHPDVVARLKARAAELAGEPPAAGSLFEIRADLSEHRRRQLRALGYVADPD